MPLRPRVAAFAVLLALTTLGCAHPQSSTPPPDMERPDKLPRAKILFEDDFDGDTLDSSAWNTCHWWDDGGCTIASNNELEWYKPEQVAVADSVLRLTAVQEPTEGADGKEFPYRSGMVTTGPPSYEGEAKFAFTYGRVEARMLLPEGQGLFPAFWLVPDTTETSKPEIDVLEVLGHDPDTLRMHFHPKDRSLESLGQNVTLPAGQGFAAAWHTLRLDWRPGELVFFVDDREVWRVTGETVPSEPLYLVANLAVGGDWPGPPDDNTVFPATYLIDYVRVTALDS